MVVILITFTVLAQTTERVSENSSGAGGNNASYNPVISSNGRYVAFYSGATNFVTGDTNDAWDVFVRDRQEGTIVRVSVPANGGQSGDDSGSGNMAISSDGRYIAFYSVATNLVVDDANGVGDVFIHDRETKTTTRASVGTGGQEGDDECDWYLSMSSDGRYVAFSSYATNLIMEGETIEFAQIYVHDRDTDQDETSMNRGQ